MSNSKIKVSLISCTHRPVETMLVAWQQSRSHHLLLTVEYLHHVRRCIRMESGNWMERSLRRLLMEYLGDNYTNQIEEGLVGVDDPRAKALVFSDEYLHPDLRIEQNSEGFYDLFVMNERPEDLIPKIISSDIPVSEVVSFVFDIENYPMKWREQAVRTRQGNYWLQTSRITDYTKFADLELYNIPPAIEDNEQTSKQFRSIMIDIQYAYQKLLLMGIKGEDASSVLPRATTERGSFTWNLRILKGLFGKRTCFTADTKIRLMDGSEIAIGDWTPGEVKYVYSTDKDGNVVPGKAWSLGRTKKKAKVLKMTLDNGESFTCTPDHQLRLRDGSYREAKDCVIGQSMMPLYTRMGEGFWDGYQEHYNPATNDWKLTHQTVIEDTKPYLDGSGFGWVRHHKDHNPLNNDPSNLEWMRWDKHKVYHQQNCKFKDLWTDPEWAAEATARNSENGKNHGVLNFVQNLPESLRIQYASNNMKKRWENPEDRANLSKVASEHTTKQWENPEIREKMSKGISKALSGGYEFMYLTSKCPVCDNPTNVKFRRFSVEDSWQYDKGIYCSRSCSNRGRSMGVASELAQPLMNHTIVAIEDAGYEDVYDISVEDHHNFALSAGIFVHNCWIAQVDNGWGNILAGISKVLAEVDPLLAQLGQPPCVKGGCFNSCPFTLDMAKRMTGEDPLEPCPIYLTQYPEEAAIYNSVEHTGSNTIMALERRLPLFKDMWKAVPEEIYTES